MRLKLDEELASKLAQADEEMLEEIVRLAEVELADSAKTALFRDQRSMAMGAAAGSMAVAGLAAFATALSVHKPLWPLAAGAAVFALFMFLAAGVCFWCARPRDYYVPGFRPQKWLPDIESGQSLHRSKAEIAAIYNAALNANEDDSKGQANGWRIAASAATAAVLLGVVVSVLTYCILTNSPTLHPQWAVPWN